ncbi:MAG: hypothetical protein NTV70_16360 [Acidobacteria bacterium]|nr:hypothetical protein [Acidobacteriota bacterium]
MTLGGLRAASAPLDWTAWFQVTLLVVSLMGLMLDSRQVMGVNAWIKPLKFCVSVLIYLVTVAWLLKDLKLGWPGAVIGWGIAAAMVVENGLIVLQAYRGVTSHFNTSNAIDGAIFGIMGVFIALNTVLMAWLLVLSWMPQAGLSPGYLAGIRWGLLLFFAGSLQAGLMLRIMAHTVGMRDGGPGLPLLNWSTRAGDLRIGHFIALHALQALPIAGWLLDRAGVVAAPVTVLILAAAMAAAFVLTTLQALAGKPLFF